MSYRSCLLQTNALGEKANSCFQLMGGKVEDLGNRVLGVDDGVSRCGYGKEVSTLHKGYHLHMWLSQSVTFWLTTFVF